MESGYSCTGGSTTSADTCYTCGDGYYISEYEECDDGNTNSNDGCSSACALETYWSCSGGSSTTEQTCSAICGDGFYKGDEECDDGDTTSGDG